MKKKQSKKQPSEATYTLYPIRPFDLAWKRHKYSFLFKTSDKSLTIPPEGTIDKDPLTDRDKELLFQLDLAKMQERPPIERLKQYHRGEKSIPVFMPNYKAIKQYLLRECHISPERLPTLRWGNVIDIVRPDLITLDVATNLYDVTRITLQRAIQDETLKSFRYKDRGPHLVRKSDIQNLYVRRKQTS